MHLNATAAGCWDVKVHRGKDGKYLNLLSHAANEKVEDINGSPRSQSQMVSVTQTFIIVCSVLRMEMNYAYEVLDYCFLTSAPLNCNISLFFESLCLFFKNGNQTVKLILQQHHSIQGMLSSTHIFPQYLYILNLLIK